MNRIWKFGTCLAIAVPFGSTQIVDNNWYLATTIITRTIFTTCENPGTPAFTAATPCSSSTEITLSNAILTGVTVQPASSPSSCYTLPTPTSCLESVGVANDTTEASDNTSFGPVYFYLDQNATLPQYLGTVIDNERYTLDLSSNDGHVGMILPGGQSLLFDPSGLHLFDASCGSVSTVNIDNFFNQMTSISEAADCIEATTQLTAWSAIRKRQQLESTFTVIVSLDHTLSAGLAQITLAFGNSQCTLVSQAASGGPFDTLIYLCQYPGEASGEKQCERNVATWLDARKRPVDDTAASGPLSAGNLATYMSPFLREAGSPLAGLFPNVQQAIQRGTSWLANTASTAARQAFTFAGSTVCQVMHLFDECVLVMNGPGLPPAGITLGNWGQAPPVPTVMQTIRSNAMAGSETTTGDPARVVMPTVLGFPEVTVTGFGGLLGGMGILPTGP